MEKINPRKYLLKLKKQFFTLIELLVLCAMQIM